jgi:superfamily II DNA or RNA helicase
MKLILSNLIEISGADKQFIDKVKSMLTVPNPLYESAIDNGRSTYGIPRNLKFFEGEKFPRGSEFIIRELASISGYDIDKVIYNLPEKNHISVSSKIKARPYQEEAVNTLIESGGGVVVAPPGSGKTILALEYIARMGLKTLWITHTSSLLEQSIERATEFLGGISIGKMGSGSNVDGDLTIAVINTLYKNLDSLDFSKYSIVIVDECHRVPAEMMNKVAQHIPAHHYVGLSATPYRKDKLDEVIHFILGPAIYEVDKKTLIEKGNILPAKVIQKNTRCIIRDREKYTDILDEIEMCNDRLDIICTDILTESLVGNTCAVLVNRIRYGKMLVDRLYEFGVKAEMVYSNEVTYEKVKVGKRVIKKRKTKAMPKKKRLDIINRFINGELNVLIATYSLLAEGFDHKPLNRLFLASPLSGKNRTLIEQTCGRVERPCVGKDDAIVYDYVDINGLLEHQARGRRYVYEFNLMNVIEE